jgi:hypothetical protein
MVKSGNGLIKKWTPGVILQIAQKLLPMSQQNYLAPSFQKEILP